MSLTARALSPAEYRGAEYRDAEYRGKAASPGKVFGPLVIVRTTGTLARTAGPPTVERVALERAVALASADLAALVEAADGDAADILEFQLALAGDTALTEAAFAAIADGVAADAAWAAALDAMIADYAQADDDYFRARAADLTDLRDRVTAILTGAAAAISSLPENAILLADDLTPSRFLALDWTGRGIALMAGSSTSHVAMLARARGVPMVVGLGALPMSDGDRLLLDGEAGRLVPATTAEDARRLGAEAEDAAEALAINSAAATRRAVTADGDPVQILINVADPAELDGVDPAICAGVGLARTELIFDGASLRTLPDEARQLRAYRALLDWAGDRPVTIRTLDAGGDKPLPGYTVDNETNSFLGLRGVRLSLRHPDVFRVQLRALLRAAVHGDLRILIPMVSVPAEMAEVRTLVNDVARDLQAAGIPHRAPPVGMMVEVPAAALMLERFDTDFVTIGSNDLTQYVMAASRDCAALDALSDAGDPAVLALIRLVVAQAASRNIPVSLCGDAGGDPSLTAKLLDTGLRSLSMAPVAVGAVKAAVAAYSGGEP